CDSGKRDPCRARRASVVHHIAEIQQVSAGVPLPDLQQSFGRWFTERNVLRADNRIKRNTARKAPESNIRLPSHSTREDGHPVLGRQPFKKPRRSNPLLACNQPLHPVLPLPQLVELPDYHLVIHRRPQIPNDALSQRPIVVPAALVLVILNQVPRYG